MRRLWAVVAALSLIAAAPGEPVQPLGLDVQGLRSNKGRILVCVTRYAHHFPDCTDDPDKRHFAVPADGRPISLGTVPPGDYAVAIIHDENGNGKLDTFAGIPREGVGFSRNPALRFGAPSFRSSQFTVSDGPMRQAVRLKYFL